MPESRAIANRKAKRLRGALEQYISDRKMLNKTMRMVTFWISLIVLAKKLKKNK